MKNNTIPIVIEMLMFFFIVMLSFLIYTSLAKNTYNEYIEKHEEIKPKHVYELKDKSEHVYETEVLTADAITLTCRIYYTYLDDNCPFEDTLTIESIIKYSSRSAFLNCYITDVLSKQNIIKEKIKHKCYEESTEYSFELKIHNIEFIL